MAKEQLPLLDAGSLLSPKKKEIFFYYLTGTLPPSQKKKSAPMVAAPPAQFSILPECFYVLERITDKRKTLLVIEGAQYDEYLKPKNKIKRWKLAYEKAFESHQAAVDLLSSLGQLLALEDPGKAPRRPGGPQEVKRIDQLRQWLEHYAAERRPRLPWSDREAELFESIYQQFERWDNVLTPKQWDLIWRFYDQMTERLNRREANTREREGR